MIFELFMPLANESGLRSALDSLFYQDTVLARLQQAEPSELQQYFPGQTGEEPESYLNRIGEWVGRKFHGYSIYHAGGRFRSAELLTLREACTVIEGGREYLIDETTAVARFIFPCGAAGHRTELNIANSNPTDWPSEDNLAYRQEAERIRFCFDILLAQAVLETTHDEEVWILESGLYHKLHVWQRQ